MSCPVLSCRIVSCLVLSCLVLSCLVLSCLVLSYDIICIARSVVSCPLQGVTVYLILFFLIVSYYIVVSQVVLPLLCCCIISNTSHVVMTFSIVIGILYPLPKSMFDSFSFLNNVERGERSTENVSSSYQRISSLWGC